MGNTLRRAQMQILISFIRLFGIFSISFAVKQIIQLDHEIQLKELIGIAILFLAFSPFRVTLPSGASWRPGITFVLFSILYFDFRIAILMVIPGILYDVYDKKNPFGEFLQSIGFLSIGIYAAGLVYEVMLKQNTIPMYVYLAITLCLFVHFWVNRLFSALLVSYRKKSSVRRQIYSIRNDLNWCYAYTYILGMIMFLVFKAYSIPGFLLVTMLLIALNQSFTYFQKLRAIEEKAYLDCLTKAESRMAWEEFHNRMNNKRILQSGLVFMLDLDHFKMINDTYGHDYGDQILKEFVSNIKKDMKRKFRLFRYGGDEFILFVFSNEMDRFNIYQEVSEMIHVQNDIWAERGLPVSVSFGNSFLSEKDKLENIVRSADKLMYMNKFEKKKIKRNIMVK